MPLIKNLPIDTNVVSTDKILVTDVNNASATKMMTIEALAAFLAKTGKANSAKDAFIYEVVSSITGDAQARFTQDNIAASIVNTLDVSRIDKNGVDRYPLFRHLEQESIKITVVDLEKDNNYGVYTIEEVSLIDGVVRITLTLEQNVELAQFSIGNTIAISGTSSAHTNGTPRQIRNGNRAPEIGDGNSGDFWIDTANDDLYGPKTAAGWGDPVSLIGPQGIQGPQGERGPAGNVDDAEVVSVTTGDPGTEATVTTELVGNDIQFTFVIPRGDTGATGAQGPKGDTGQTGPRRGVGNVTTSNVANNSDGSVGTATASVVENGDNADYTFGIPVGETGAAAGFGTPTVTTIANKADGTPGDATVTASGPDTAKVFALGLPAGAKGDTGDTLGIGTVTTNDVDVDSDGNSQDASVTLTKNGSNVDYVFGIPTGSTGAQGPQGDKGDKGDTGNAGADGRTILNGTADPIASTGENGDFYINTTSYQIFGPKTAGAWGTGTDLEGTDGKTVLNGTTDPSDSSDGVDGDFYINTTSYQIFGPKASGAWGSGTDLQGADGDDGLFSSVANEAATPVNITGVTRLLAGDHLSFTKSGTDLILNATGISGGGNEVNSEVSLAVTGFDADTFSNETATLTATATTTPNDGTISQVQFSSTSGTISAADATQTYVDGTNTYTASITGFDEGDVTVTITFSDDDVVNDTASDSESFSKDKDNPAYSPTFTYSGFANTPSGTSLEAYDTGTVTVTTKLDETDNNGWDVDDSGATYSPSLNSDDEFTIASNNNDITFKVDAGWDQANPTGTDTLASFTVGSHIWRRELSIRIGSTDKASFTAAEVQDLTSSGVNWGTDIKYGTTNPNGQKYDLTRAAGERFYLLTETEIDLDASTDSNNVSFNGVWTKGTSVSGFHFYYTDAGAPIASGYSVTLRT